LLEEELKSASILIVDDNINNLQVLGGFLQHEGLSVEFARDGNSALVWLEKQWFDLILLDIMMPGMDGYQVCTQIKSNPALSDIPVIFITAKVDTESIIKGFNAGAIDYITKPFIQSELLVRVKTHLSNIISKQKIVEYLNRIEQRNKDINSSITYARNIQNAVLTASELNLKYMPEHFILNLPKDILSGDFYWVGVIDEQIIFALMDCTGHGVPGALMSILGISLLNETVLHERIDEPRYILESLRSKLIVSLGQNEQTTNVKDAIEGVIINFNKRESTVRFSGTTNPIVHIHNHELNEIRGDRIPIGFFEKKLKFSSRTITVQEGDLLYLFSDGYLDQFGGPEGRKIMSHRFRDLLTEYHDLPLEVQKMKFSEYLSNWKGAVSQTDDILLVGIRF